MNIIIEIYINSQVIIILSKYAGMYSQSSDNPKNLGWLKHSILREFI